MSKATHGGPSCWPRRPSATAWASVSPFPAMAATGPDCVTGCWTPRSSQCCLYHAPGGVLCNLCRLLAASQSGLVLRETLAPLWPLPVEARNPCLQSSRCPHPCDSASGDLDMDVTVSLPWRAAGLTPSSTAGPALPDQWLPEARSVSMEI